MNNPFCTGITFIMFSGRNIRVEYTCRQIKIKIPHGKKPLILNRVENDCYVCPDRRVDDWGYSEIRFNKVWTNLFRFTYCLFNNKENFLGKKKRVVIRHKCDNPSCNNPVHLEEGIHNQNMRDMMQRQRQCRGSKNHNAVLDEMTVKLILQSDMPNDYLAELYGVSETTISDIKSRKTWKHVQVEKIDSDDVTY